MSKTILIVLALILAACNAAPTPTPLPTALSNQLSKQVPGTAPAGTQVLLVQSVTAVGLNRFAIGLQRGDSFVKGATLSMSFYDLTGQKEKLVRTVPAVYREGPDGQVGIYTAMMNFPTAGSWGLAVKGTDKDGNPIDQQVGFDVVASSPELAVGKQAPSVKTPTMTSTGGDIKKLTSSTTPNPLFYQLSLDDAIKNGQPTVVQFSTPAFCTSRLCGPVYDVMSQVTTAYSRQLNFVQVEVYKDLPNPNLNNPQWADAFLAFVLQNEPWTYVLDKNGVVTWRAEGLIATDELKKEQSMMD